MFTYIKVIVMFPLQPPIAPLLMVLINQNLVIDAVIYTIRGKH
jgi:hypothetical protein